MEYTPIQVKKDRKMSTPNRLNVETLGFRRIMPENLAHSNWKFQVNLFV